MPNPIMVKRSELEWGDIVLQGMAGGPAGNLRVG